MRPEVRPIPDAFLTNSRGCGVSHRFRELLRQGCGFKVEMYRGWTIMGALLPRSSMTHCEQALNWSLSEAQSPDDQVRLPS